MTAPDETVIRAFSVGLAIVAPVSLIGWIYAAALAWTTWCRRRWPTTHDARSHARDARRLSERHDMRMAATYTPER